MVWVIMPVYNEEESLSHVLDAWLPTFRNHLDNFVFCIIDDGSTDDSLNILTDYAQRNKEISIVSKPNSGHGQTCIEGYKRALDSGANWVFQIDSDHQCDPRYFSECVIQSENHDVVYGFRKTRADGWKRSLVSRIVTLFVWAATGVWVRDANVPYRLMNAKTLVQVVDQVPDKFHLANVLISTYQEHTFGINWVDIHFNNRFGGEPSVNMSLFAKHGLVMFKQLRKSVNQVKKSSLL